MNADDYDRENYDEDYEDSEDSQKRPPPPPPPPPPKTSASLTPDHRTILLSYYNNIFILYGTTKNVTDVPLKDTKPQHFPFNIVLILLCELVEIQREISKKLSLKPYDFLILMYVQLAQYSTQVLFLLFCIIYKNVIL